MRSFSLITISLLAGWTAAKPILLAGKGEVSVTTKFVTSTMSCDGTPVTPSPAALICGQVGQLKDDSSLMIMESPQSTSDICLQNCLTDIDDCVAFSFNSDSGLCSFYNSSIKSTMFVHAGTTETFWNKRCEENECA